MGSWFSSSSKSDSGASIDGDKISAGPIKMDGDNISMPGVTVSNLQGHNVVSNGVYGSMGNLQGYNTISNNVMGSMGNLQGYNTISNNVMGSMGNLDYLNAGGAMGSTI